MKVWDVIKTANSNLMRNKSRSFLTILAILIGSFTIIMTTGVNNGVNGYIDKQMESAGGEGYLEISKEGSINVMSGGISDEVKEYNPDSDSATASVMNKDDIDKIKSVDGVESAKMWRMIQAEYITKSDNSKQYVINIAEMPTDSIKVDMAAGSMVNITGSTPEISIAEKFVKPLGFSSSENAIGKSVYVAVANQLTGKVDKVEVKISGIINPTVIGMGRSWINTAAADKLYDIVTADLPQEYKEQSYFATAQLKDSYLSSEKTSEVKDDMKKIGYNAMTVEDSVGIIKTFFDAITIVLTIFGVIALVAASIGIINTLFMAVQERTREIGLMKAMGLGRGKIFTMFSWEAAMLGFWGAALGVGLAYVAAFVANSYAGSTFLKDLPGFKLVDFNPVTLAVIVLIVMTIAFLAGTLPARRASKKDPIEALRYE